MGRKQTSQIGPEPAYGAALATRQDRSFKNVATATSRHPVVRFGGFAEMPTDPLGVRMEMASFVLRICQINQNTVTYKNQPGIGGAFPLEGTRYLYTVKKVLWPDEISEVLQSLLVSRSLHVCCGHSQLGLCASISTRRRTRTWYATEPACHSLTSRSNPCSATPRTLGDTNGTMTFCASYREWRPSGSFFSTGSSLPTPTAFGKSGTSFG